MKKKLTTKERVDRLLKEGVDNPKKWAAVHDYKEPEGPVSSWKSEWERLRQHHLEETFFLFEMLREMANRLNPPPPLLRAPKPGDKVVVPWWEHDMATNKPPKRVKDLTGTIESINGAYHYVKVDNNPKYDVIELYPNEFQVVK
jgi:hypothetical protein